MSALDDTLTVECPASPGTESEKSSQRSPTSNDEFWDALSSHYDYLMDDGLIATCREASSDLSLDDDENMTNAQHAWTFIHFNEQFKQLHDKLHALLEAMKKGFNESHLEEQKKISFSCKHFSEQGQKLIVRYPEMKDEVNRYLNILNNKWKAVEHTISPKKAQPAKDTALNEITTLVKCLRRWLRELEERLCPKSLAAEFNLEKLKEKYREQLVLQKQIKEKGKYVNALLKHVQHFDGGNTSKGQKFGLWDAEHFRRVSKNLEEHWHSIWLKSLESQVVIESYMRKIESATSDSLDNTLTEEPVKKQPRLDLDRPTHILTRPSGFSKAFACGVTKELKSPTNDKGVMVGNTGIAELKARCNGSIGKFEIVQDVGYSSETSAHFSNDEQIDHHEALYHSCLPNNDGQRSPSSKEVQTNSDTITPLTHISNSPVPRKLFLTPDKYPSPLLKRYVSDSVSSALSYDAKYSKSVPDSFYKMTSELEGFETAPEKASCNGHSIPSDQKSKYNECLVNNSSKSKVQAQKVTLSEGGIDEKCKRSEKVTAWLNHCHSSDDITSDEYPEQFDKGTHLKHTIQAQDKNLNSCDASGEYTESDGEKSAASEDVDNSVTQSFTGSVETVVKALKEETKSHSDHAGKIGDQSLCVHMRKKSKKVTRDRPWSVTELHQVAIVPSGVTHSTSEGALNSISYSPHLSTKSAACSRKLRLGGKKLSLTDLAVASSPLAKVQRLIGSNGTTSSTDRSDGCFSSSKEEPTLANGVCVDRPPRSRKSHSSYSSDKCSASSCNSTLSRRHKHKRRLRSSRSQASSKHKSHSDESSVEENRSTKQLNNPLAKQQNIQSCAEDHSSVSDQVWDEYQDPPYLSEPYSEQTADEDQVKKLINFGDDYRAVLGSQSDGSSAKSTCKTSVRSRSKYALSNKDSMVRQDLPNSASDSDAEDFSSLLSTSLQALHYVRNCIVENLPNKSFPSSSDFAELIATCQTHLCHLYTIHDELLTEPKFKPFSPSSHKQFRALMKDWEVLQAKLRSLTQQSKEPELSVEQIQIAILDIESIMYAQKSKLNALWKRASDALSDISSIRDLKRRISTLQTGLADLQDLKGAVLSVSARIVRLISESGSESALPLRDTSAKLYQQWEDVYELSSAQLTKLQRLQTAASKVKLDKQPASEVAKTESDHCLGATSAEQKIASGVDDINDEGLNNLFNAEKRLKELFPLYPSGFGIRCDDETDNKATGNHLGSFISTRSKLWRALRASMPFHLALVISYCITRIMEPQCCENMNTLDFSFFPQLRHLEGPPAV